MKISPNKINNNIHLLRNASKSFDNNINNAQFNSITNGANGNYSTTSSNVSSAANSHSNILDTAVDELVADLQSTAKLKQEELDSNSVIQTSNKNSEESSNFQPSSPSSSSSSSPSASSLPMCSNDINTIEQNNNEILSNIENTTQLLNLNQMNENLNNNTASLNSPQQIPVLTFQIEIDDTIKKRIDEKLKECSSGDSDSDSEVNVYTPKAVDLPSAQRLAKRLYYLDGFKSNDVIRHLSKK